MREAASQLAFVEELRTVCRPLLKAQSSSVSGYHTGPTPQRVYEFSSPRACQFLIARPPPGLSVSWMLAQSLSRILGSPGVTLPLHPFLDVGLSNGPCDSMDLQALLLPGSYDPNLEKASQAGALGQPLLPSDEAAVELKPLRRHHAGEIVAIHYSDLIAETGGASSTSAAALAAQAAERRSSQAASTASDESPNNLVYARVAASCASQHGEVLYRRVK